MFGNKIQANNKKWCCAVYNLLVHFYQNTMTLKKIYKDRNWKIYILILIMDLYRIVNAPWHNLLNLTWIYFPYFEFLFHQYKIRILVFDLQLVSSIFVLTIHFFSPQVSPFCCDTFTQRHRKVKLMPYKTYDETLTKSNL